MQGSDNFTAAHFVAKCHTRSVTRGGTMFGAPNHWEVPKSPNNVASFSLIQYIYFQKTLGLNMGTPNLFLAPGPI